MRKKMLRSILLILLGVAIGAGAVIAVVMARARLAATPATGRGIAIIQGNAAASPASMASSTENFGAASFGALTPEDCDAIFHDCPHVQDVAPIIRVRTQVLFQKKNWAPNWIYGTTPSFLDIHDWAGLSQGSAFTETDVRNASKVCIIGQTLVNELFDGQSPLGQEVRVRNTMFKVVGVLSAKGINKYGMDNDDILLAPWTTIKFRVSGQASAASNQSAVTTAPGEVNTLGQLHPGTGLNLFDQTSAAQQADAPVPVRFITVDQILFSTDSPDKTPLAIREVTDVLRERHGSAPGEPDHFEIRDLGLNDGAGALIIFSGGSGVGVSFGRQAGKVGKAVRSGNQHRMIRSNSQRRASRGIAI